MLSVNKSAMDEIQAAENEMWRKALRIDMASRNSESVETNKSPSPRSEALLRKNFSQALLLLVTLPLERLSNPTEDVDRFQPKGVFRENLRRAKY